MARKLKEEREILKIAHERYNHCTTVYGEMHQKHSEIMRFISGEQWTYVARQAFENAGFAAMTSNRIPTFLRQITNEIRKNPPQIQIDSKDDGDVATAVVLDDLIRNIQLDSNADTAYVEAAESAAAVGIGYIIVRSEYEDDKSFNQKIIIESVNDSNQIMLDPNHKGLSGEDSLYAFKTVIISKEEYKRKYKDTKLSKNLEDVQWVSGKHDWIKKEGVMICEYYFKDFETKTLCQTYNQETGETKQEYKEDIDPLSLADAIVIILQERKVDIPIIRWCKLNEVEVLEESIWPGNFIPVVAVKADEYWLEGKRKLVGAVEPAIEAQVKLNYAMSYQCQLLQMAPKAPYIGTAIQFQTYEQQWANINVSNQAFMVYNHDQDAPPPSRDLGEIPIQAASELCAQSEEDLKSIFGVFDPSQQAIGPESGKAILARQAQSYNSNYHFYDNLAKSIQHIGRIIVEAIPEFYDTPRQIQGLTQSGEKHSTMVNEADEYGKIKHDLSKPGYAVSIETGPSFGTKRQEAVEALTAIMDLSPEMAQNLADLAISNMDIPGAKEAAARARAMVAPNVLAAAQDINSEDVTPQIVQNLKTQVGQLTQQLQAVKPEMDEMKMKLTDAEQQNKMLTHDNQVEATKIELEYKTKQRECDLKEAVATMEFQVKEMELKLAFEELELKKKEIGIKGAVALSDVSTESLEQAREHHRHVVEMTTPEDTDVDSGSLGGAMDKDLE